MPALACRHRALVFVLTLLGVAVTTQAQARPLPKGNHKTAPLPGESGLQLELPLLRTFREPSIETPSEAWRFLWGPWGLVRWQGTSSYWLDQPVTHWVVPAMGHWLQADSSRAWAGAWWKDSAWKQPVSLHLELAPLPQPLSPAPADPVATCLRKAVTFARHGSESDRFSLLTCDGEVAPEAIDRLSVMARPPNVPRPELPLPDEPDANAGAGEWLPSIRLVHPRLVWLTQQVAEAFPGRWIYIVSGYRPGPHEGKHAEGRALDLHVMGVDDAALYKWCRKLRDAGCGYYPNHNFVHLDVRPSNTGRVYWIDISQPGEPSEYVKSWPGVEDGTGSGWLAGVAR